jgi:hypothetical protein
MPLTALRKSRDSKSSSYENHMKRFITAVVLTAALSGCGKHNSELRAKQAHLRELQEEKQRFEQATGEKAKRIEELRAKQECFTAVARPAATTPRQTELAGSDDPDREEQRAVREQGPELLPAATDQLAIPEGYTSVTLVPAEIDAWVLRQTVRPLYTLIGTGGGIKSSSPHSTKDPVEFHVGNRIFWEAIGLSGDELDEQVRQVQDKNGEPPFILTCFRGYFEEEATHIAVPKGFQGYVIFFKLADHNAGMCTKATTAVFKVPNQQMQNIGTNAPDSDFLTVWRDDL